MDYLVLDVETASTDLGSICQIGVVTVSGGRIVDEYSTLVDPGCDFNPYNVRVHGITPCRVRGAPRFSQIYADLGRRIAGRLVVQQGGIDKSAMTRAALGSGLAPIEATWINNVSVARRVWPGLPGYDLARLAARLGLSFRHHDALEDARVTHAVFSAALAESGTAPHEWPARLAPSRSGTRGFTR